jgi:Domain of unknown function (DUF3291)
MKQYLAQLNIARMLTSDINDPIMAEFVAQLDEVNGIAESSPGFIWRLKDENDNATNFRPFDERTIVNLSIWENITALENFAYNGRHVEVMRNRRQWFEKPTEPMVVLWWIDENQTPSVYEAKARLEHLRKQGSTDYAFDFKYAKTKNMSHPEI